MRNDNDKQHIKFTVADLLEERKQYSWSFPSPLFKGRVIAIDAKDGKRLFDTRNNKHDYVTKFYDRNIDSMWVEMRNIFGKTGFHVSYEAVLMLYIDHEKEE